MTGIRINARSKVDNKLIRKEVLNGRAHIVVPSVTMPDDIIMNGGKYPAAAIKDSYKTLEGTLAPLGHPKIDGVEVSALEALAINANHIGAFNRNVERKGGRVHVEKWIDVDTAMQSDGGRRVLQAIEKGLPIHTSTGVFAKRQMVTNAAGYNWIASELRFDHDAILLDEEAAATPDEGVGMFVNSKDECLVINSNIEDGSFESKFDLAIAFLRDLFGAENIPKKNEVELNPEPAQAEKKPQGDTELDEKAITALGALFANALKPLGEKLDALATAQDKTTLQINEQTKAFTAAADAAKAGESKEMLERLTEKHGALIANALIKDPEAATAAYLELKTAAGIKGGLHTNSNKPHADELAGYGEGK